MKLISKKTTLLYSIWLLAVFFFEANAQYEYDVSKAVYNGDTERFYVGDQEVSPYTVAFNNDGSKMFITGSSRFIYEYNLSVGYDVSTATYAGDAERFNLATWVHSPRALRFNDTGVKMYVLDYGNEDITEFNLTAAYDVSTASYIQEFSTAPLSIYPFSFTMSTDGSKIYVVEFLNENIIEYTLSTNFDISTASHSFTKSISAQEPLPYSIRFTPDGTKMYVLGQRYDAISQFSLSTAFDLSTATYDGNTERFSILAQESQATSMNFNSDGTKLFVLGLNGKYVNEYLLTNFAPEIAGTVAGQTVNDNQLISPFSTVTIADVNRDQLSATITLDNYAKGVLSGAGLNGTGPYTINSTSVAAIQSALRALEFDPAPDRMAFGLTETTTFTLQITDGLLNDTDNTTTVIVTSANDAPTLTATAVNPAFTEDGPTVNLFYSAAASTIEAGQSFIGFSLEVTNVSEGSNEILNADGTAIELTDANSGITSVNSLNYSVSVSGNTATITFSGGSMTATAIQDLFNNLSYLNTSNDPNVTNRVATIETIQDDAGTANGGDDTGSPSVSSTITIISVNDAPSFTLGSDQNVNQDSGLQTVTGFATNISDGEDNSTQVLTFNVSNDNNALFSVQPDIDESTGDLTYTPAPGMIGTATVTVSLSDDGGTANGGIDQSADQTFEISVNDVTPPIGYSVSIDQSVIVSSNISSISFTFAGAEIGATYNYTFSSDGGGTDVTGSGTIATATDQITNINLSGLDDGIVTLGVTLTDVNANTGAIVTDTSIKDTSPPVPDVAVLPDLTDELSVSAIAPTATDNFAGLVTGTTTTVFPVSTQGTTVITWTYDDGNDNTSTQTQNVIINDVTPPVADVAVLPDLTDELSVSAPAAPTATDNFAGVVTGTTTTVFPVTAQGTTVIMWTYDDGNGNTSTQTQNVIINDVTPPVADIAVLPDLTDELSVSAPAAPTATDNFAGMVTGTTATIFPITTQGTTVIKWTYDDGNENTSSQTQNVVINDVTPPVPDVAVLPDLTDELSVSAPVAPTATDNFAGVVTGTTTTVFPISTQVTTVVTWTYDDGNGNTSTQTQNVIINDVTPPPAFDALFVDIQIDLLNEENVEFIIENGEIGATYNYTITSLENPSQEISGSGTINSANEILFVNLSGFPNGRIELEVILIDHVGNESSPVIDEIMKLSGANAQRIPEGFSPNGDGVNDTWIIPGIEQFPNNRVTVFNRYGKIVWQIRGYNNDRNAWNGDSGERAVMGSSITDGTYYYVIDYGENNISVKSGYVIVKK